MKAAVRRKYGIQNLKIEDISKPVPKDDEVLIRVYATTVNRTDYAVLTGIPFVMRFFTGLWKPKLPVPGTDFAGTIEAVGKSVKSFQVHDRVFGFRDEGLASQAEYMVFSMDGAISKIPGDYSYEQAAASLEGAHYAFNFMNKVTLEAGQKVMLNGATGAIGSALLQFLKYKNIEVTAVCNTKNVDWVKSRGADKIYDYTKEDFTKDTEQYDFVFDAVGKSTFGACRHLLKPGGAYISSELGPYAQNIFLPLTTRIFGNKRVLFPLPTNIKRSIEFISELVTQGRFVPLIDRVYPLKKISEAYEYVNTGEKSGNVILSLKEIDS